MMENMVVYGITRGDENSVPVMDDVAYECLEDAIQEARLRNSRQLISDETSLEDVFGTWQQTTEADLSELITAALIDSRIKSLADAIQKKTGEEISVREAIDSVIAESMEHNTLPTGWWGVRNMVLHRPDENY